MHGAHNIEHNQCLWWETNVTYLYKIVKNKYYVYVSNKHSGIVPQNGAGIIFF